ncbi:MAG: hypothetical protein A3J60_00650 [Candidatus Pacebacteria bacterium RIFCSPHIGHO2_02_FULL_46_9]|nr:MAG: hypothetical protein A3J60_00650 [Candidatus Pacebacteria bacterium RIFCSPHIGHO2_02_FULL_46_9]
MVNATRENQQGPNQCSATAVPIKAEAPEPQPEIRPPALAELEALVAQRINLCYRRSIYMVNTF